MSNEIQRDSRRFSHNHSAVFLIAFADACGALKTGELIKSAAAKTRIPAKTETQNVGKDWVPEERRVDGAGRPCFKRLRLCPTSRRRQASPGSPYRRGWCTCRAGNPCRP